MTTLDDIRPLAKQYRRLAECGIMPFNPSFQEARNWIDEETEYCYDLNSLNDSTYALVADLERLRAFDPWGERIALIFGLLGLATLTVCLLAIF